MRFEFDHEKSRQVKRNHGVSLHEAREIFDQVYHHLITAWKATEEEEQAYAENV